MINPDHKKCWSFFFITSILFISYSGCSKKEEGKKIPITGAVIVTDGSNAGMVYNFNLQTGKIDTLLSNKGELYGRIVRISDSEFVIEDWNKLVKFNLTSHQITTMRNGEDQTYVEESRKLFFYCQVSFDEKMGSKYGLYVASMDSLERPMLLAKSPAPPHSPVAPVQISADEIVFIGEDANIWEYNIASNSLISTGIPGDYRPIAWIKAKGVLLCSLPDSGIGLYGVNLITKEKRRLGIIKDILDTELGYIEKYNVVIYSDVNHGLFGELSGTSHDLYVYSFSKQVSEKLASNLRMDSEVYLDR